MLESQSQVRPWSVEDAGPLFGIDRWGQGYFSVGSDGHLRVHPQRDANRFVDLWEQVERLQLRGIKLPILFRFGQILEDRLRNLNDAFQTAITEQRYQGSYCCVYPIKVNQQRQVVEEVLQFGSPFGFGLEVGSKPELVAVVCLASNETPIICNGFKDAEYLRTVLLGQKIGRNITTVIEKYSELELALKLADKEEVRPRLGMRVKLAAKGSGRWESSGGNRSKFGLTASEILRGARLLKERGMLDCLKLLHFHLGSQITDIRNIIPAVEEAARFYVGLANEGAELEMLDVGGGLGVDYDGSRTTSESSVNYTLEEYAVNVVHQIQTVCDEAGVNHPTIISESGRAVAAYHSVLLFDVLETAEPHPHEATPVDARTTSKPLGEILDVQDNVASRHPLESFHDAERSLEEAALLFGSGQITIEERAQVEDVYWQVCQTLRQRIDQLKFVPEELKRLDELLSSTYYCNFSLFQSVPDSWAIKQLFPVLPIHRLDEYPDRLAVLGDITCDSDGRVEQFVGCHETGSRLRLHSPNGRPYYLGIFLVGAYQEILGDLHNLLGDTNAVHISLNADGEVVLDSVVEGDTVREVLEYVEFDAKDLLRGLRIDIDAARRHGKIDDAQSGRIFRYYKSRLLGYTYLKSSPQKATTTEQVAVKMA